LHISISIARSATSTRVSRRRNHRSRKNKRRRAAAEQRAYRHGAHIIGGASRRGGNIKPSAWRMAWRMGAGRRIIALASHNASRECRRGGSAYLAHGQRRGRS